MKKVIAILVCYCFLLGSAQAQSNILNQLNVANIEPYNWFECGNNYFFLSAMEHGLANPNITPKRIIYFLSKYNKFTNQHIQSVYVAGDTLQPDSVIVYPRMFAHGGRIGLVYAWAKEDTVSHAILYSSTHYTQYDTNLNIVTEPVLLDSLISGVVRSVEPLYNGNAMISYESADWNYSIAQYLEINDAGQIVRSDTVPQNPHGLYKNLHAQTVRLPGNQYMFYGWKMAGPAIGSEDPVNPSGQILSWAITNQSLQVIDTMYFKHGLVADPTPWVVPVLMPCFEALPGGSLVSASSVSGTPNNPAVFPLISKYTKATRYGLDDYINFPIPVDNQDQGTSKSQIKYNPFDNNLYYTAVTHRGNFGFMCTPSIGYAEVISLDTNLNVRWRKFIKLGSCSSHGTTAVPDGRGGIIMTGMSGSPWDNTEQKWAYYINDNTPSDNPTGMEDVFIKKDDGFVLYPVPATDEVHLISLDRSIKEASLYDLSGRLLVTQPVDQGRAIINTERLSTGIYIIKASTHKGAVYQKKLVKK